VEDRECESDFTSSTISTGIPHQPSGVHIRIANATMPDRSNSSHSGKVYRDGRVSRLRCSQVEGRRVARQYDKWVESISILFNIYN